MFVVIPDNRSGSGIDLEALEIFDDAVYGSRRLIFLALHRIKRLVRDGIFLDDITDPKYAEWHMEEYGLDTHAHKFHNVNSYRVQGLTQVLLQYRQANGATQFQTIDHALANIDALLGYVKAM